MYEYVVVGDYIDARAYTHSQPTSRIILVVDFNVLRRLYMNSPFQSCPSSSRDYRIVFTEYKSTVRDENNSREHINISRLRKKTQRIAAVGVTGWGTILLRRCDFIKVQSDDGIITF